MSEHELDFPFDLLEQRPWTSVVINSRVMTIKDTNYSLQSSLTWRQETSNERRLVNEYSIRGSLFSLQKWYLTNDDSSILTAKPLPGSCLVDIMGQYRTDISAKQENEHKKKAKLPFIAND